MLHVKPFVGIFCLLILILPSPSVLGQASSIKIEEKTTSISSDSLRGKVEIGGNEVAYYRTIEMSEYLALKKKESKLTARKGLAMDTLYLELTPSIREKYKNEIQTLNEELDNIAAQKKKLYIEYVKDYLRFKRLNIFGFGPIRSEAFYEIVYGDQSNSFKVLNTAGLNLGNNTGSVYTELASGNMWVFRVSLGAMVTNSAETGNGSGLNAKEKEALQRLQTYGGNAVLGIEYPLLFIHSKDNRFNLISRIISKGTADFPEFGTTTDDFAASGSIGVDFYGEAPLSNNSLTF